MEAAQPFFVRLFVLHLWAAGSRLLNRNGGSYTALLCSTGPGFPEPHAPGAARDISCSKCFSCVLVFTKSLPVFCIP